MKSISVSLGLLGAIVVALALAAPVSAETEHIPANDSFDLQVGELGIGLFQGSDLSFSWTSDSPLTLVIYGPSGMVESYPSHTHGDDTIHIQETGSYTMTWTNSGPTSATLTYHTEVDLFAPARDVFDAFLVGLIVVAVIIVVIVVLVVVLIMRGEKKQPAAQAQRPFQPLGAGVTVCPTCGAPIESTTIWCARCGTKLR